MRIYIAGKITGDKDYIEKFNRAQQKIEEVLHAEVINPACLVLPESCTWDDYMRITLQMLDLAEGVALLPDWRSSPGACMECGYALAQDKHILHYEKIIDKKPNTIAERITASKISEETIKKLKLDPPPPKTAQRPPEIKKERTCQKCGGQITGRGRKILCDQCKESEETLPE